MQPETCYEENAHEEDSAGQPAGAVPGHWFAAMLPGLFLHLLLLLLRLFKYVFSTAMLPANGQHRTGRFLVRLRVRRLRHVWRRTDALRLRAGGQRLRAGSRRRTDALRLRTGGQRLRAGSRRRLWLLRTTTHGRVPVPGMMASAGPGGPQDGGYSRCPTCGAVHGTGGPFPYPGYTSPTPAGYQAGYPQQPGYPQQSGYGASSAYPQPQTPAPEPTGGTVPPVPSTKPTEAPSKEPVPGPGPIEQIKPTSFQTVSYPSQTPAPAPLPSTVSYPPQMQMQMQMPMPAAPAGKAPSYWYPD